MKLSFIALCLLLLSLTAFSQTTTYVSKKQIKVGYENGKVDLSQSSATFIIKTDFNFKHTIGAHYLLTLITDNDEVFRHHITFKGITKKGTETEYHFAAEELEDYPSEYIEITIDPEANFNAGINIINQTGKFMFYCNKVK